MKLVSKSLIAALGVCLAGPLLARTYVDYAPVTRVDRLLEVVDTPVATECWSEPRTEIQPGAEYRRETVEPDRVNPDGSITKVRRELIQKGLRTDVERVCQTEAANPETRVVGYNVVYRYRGAEFRDRLDHDPGSRVRVQVDDGYVAIAE